MTARQEANLFAGPFTIAIILATAFGITHAEQPAAPPDAAAGLARLKSLDAAAVECIGPSPSDKVPGDAVRRLIEIEKANFVLIEQLWQTNAMSQGKSQQLWLDRGMPPKSPR